MIFLRQQQFEDTNMVIRCRKSKEIKIQWPIENGQTMIYKTLHRKLKIKQHTPHKHWMNSCVPEEITIPVPLVAPVVLLLNDTDIIWYGNRV